MQSISTKIVVIRDICRSEYSWLDRDIKTGEIWYKSQRPDIFGVCTPNGILAYEHENKDENRYELPLSHVKVVD